MLPTVEDVLRECELALIPYCVFTMLGDEMCNRAFRAMVHTQFVPPRPSYSLAYAQVQSQSARIPYD